jgi:hypothetical protein
MRSNVATAGTVTNEFPSTSSRIRTLTVSTVHREWSATCGRQHSYVPALRLYGRWLRSVGFAPGQKVRVILGAGMIVISVLDLPR